MNNKCVKYYLDPTWQWGVMARTRILGICSLWSWPWRYDLESRSWHTLGSWTTIVWNIIQIQHGSEELWPWHGFWVCVHCDLGDITLGQGHGTPLGHGQKLCEILSRSDKGVRSYGPDTMWTDGQTERVIPIYPPQTLFAGGIIITGVVICTYSDTQDNTVQGRWLDYRMLRYTSSLYTSSCRRDTGKSGRGHCPISPQIHPHTGYH